MLIHHRGEVADKAAVAEILFRKVMNNPPRYAGRWFIAWTPTLINLYRSHRAWADRVKGLRARGDVVQAWWLEFNNEVKESVDA